MDNADAKKKFSVLEVIGGVVAISSVLGAFCWGLGAIYTQALYDALGISLKFVGYENNELINSGAWQLAFYLLYCAVLLAIYALLLVSRDFLLKLINNTQNRLFRKANSQNSKKIAYYIIFFGLLMVAFSVLFINGFPDKEMTDFNTFPTRLFIFFYFFSCSMWLAIKNPLNEETKYMNAMEMLYVLFVGLFLFVLFIANILQTSSRGYIAGCEAISAKSNEVIVYSNHPLPLENEISNSDKLFEYSGYYSLFGKDSLLLYKELDSTTNTPYQAIVLKRSEIIGYKRIASSITSSERTAITSKCEAIVEKRVSDSYGN